MKLTGDPFQNSLTCSGVLYKDGANLDMAIIEISGRYPDRGWAVNAVVHEMAQVSRGEGKLMFENGEALALGEGEVVSVKPGQKFAWDGDMTLVMACSPAFSSDQYKVEDNS